MAAQLTLVDNVGMKAAASKLCAATARRIQKLRCSWLPVNSRESRSDPDRLPRCSACSTTGLVLETVDHLFQCHASSRQKEIKAIFARLHNRFSEWKTSRHLISALKSGATAWLEGREIPPVTSLDLPQDKLGRLIAQAYTDPTMLGWNVLFRGFWVKNWRLAQEEQFQLYHSPERQDTSEGTFMKT